MRTRQRFLLTSWIPLACLAAVLWYLKQFDGWGSWGAAPLFLPVISLSAIAGLLGIVLCFRQWRNGHRDFRLFAATLLAGSVALYYCIRGFQ
jgi:hypothetical protein